MYIYIYIIIVFLYKHNKCTKPVKMLLLLPSFNLFSDLWLSFIKYTCFGRCSNAFGKFLHWENGFSITTFHLHILNCHVYMGRWSLTDMGSGFNSVLIYHSVRALSDKLKASERIFTYKLQWKLHFAQTK